MAVVVAQGIEWELQVTPDLEKTKLTPEQRRDLKLASGLLVEDVKGAVTADIRPGDVVLSLTARGVTIEAKTVEQFNQALAKLDKNIALTLQVRRGENNLFVTIKANGDGK